MFISKIIFNDYIYIALLKFGFTQYNAATNVEFNAIFIAFSFQK